MDTGLAYLEQAVTDFRGIALRYGGFYGAADRVIQLEGDTAVGRAYVSELVRFRNGSSQLNYSVYHDCSQRTSDGWKFTERIYKVR